MKIILYLVLVLREFINILSLTYVDFFHFASQFIYFLYLTPGNQSQIFYFEIHKL